MIVSNTHDSPLKQALLGPMGPKPRSFQLKNVQWVPLKICWEIFVTKVYIEISRACFKGQLRSKFADFYLYLRLHFDRRESAQVESKSNHFFWSAINLYLRDMNLGDPICVHLKGLSRVLETDSRCSGRMLKCIRSLKRLFHTLSILTTPYIKGHGRNI